MTVYETIKDMTIDEMIEFLDLFDVDINKVYCRLICEHSVGNMCTLSDDDNLPCNENKKLEYQRFLHADFDSVIAIQGYI